MPKTHPAFYITGNGAELINNYGAYAVMAFEPMALLDNRPSYAGDVYYTASDLRRVGINEDNDLRVLLDLGMVKFITEPYFSIWEIGDETPMQRKYYDLTRASRVANAYASSEPAQLITN